ncbi:putative metal-binding motif-containing protein [Solirubrobacter phytolaccae]|uniref:Metal-binding motif-containing protein n=1 Tax=Solirubrobacter phytolaccae TaxID=1404360 RepID=A0A9X3NAB2_9ACTN|nr:putative metal-binding motif-containing protein [Solirubrobacter phytolaccae]MDA0179007.1 putative metal-binding motif-containing protein [Solirubrobacter phytolaccae]
MRALVGGVTVAAMLLMAATAQAERVDMMTPWAWAWVDNQPFVDPSTGAPLGANSAHPRGQIKDRGTPDSYSVKMTVTALGTAGQQLDQYTVSDGSAVYRDLDRRLNLSAPVQSVRFDLCTVPNAQCVTQTFARPAPPASPGPAPGATPTPTVQPAPPADRDGDGFPDTTDCNDTNSSVFPGAREYPGNGLDDDCAGGDQAAKMPGGVKYDWTVTARTNPKVRFMRVRDAVAGAQVTVTCEGRGCPFKLRRKTTDQHGEVSLTKLFKGRRLRSGTRVEVHVAAPNMITKVTRFTIRRGVTPSGTSLCVPVGQLKPQRRC